jgi:cholesterol transport system auxiliary component
MTRFLRTGGAAALAASLAACSLLGGGGKPPPVLFTLTSSATPSAQAARSSAVGQAVTIEAPSVPRELRTNRVPVQVSPTEVQYVSNLQWVDSPDRLFQSLLEETVRRTTNRVVLNPAQSALDPGLVVTGQLNRFGYDAPQGSVVVQYDASLATQNGAQVESRRFEARIPADGTAATVAPALNEAANQVATQVAQWIGG